MKSNDYVNKKSQAPSYTDRILFKNNTSFEDKLIDFHCVDDMWGSDHRPIVQTRHLTNRRAVETSQIKSESLEQKLQYLMTPTSSRYMSLNLNQSMQNFGILSF